ncbi:hypothetical protein [Cellulomonas hominis]
MTTPAHRSAAPAPARWRPVAGLVLVLALVAGVATATLSTASAAGLSLRVGKLTSLAMAGRCTADAVQATAGPTTAGTATTVALSALPAACLGRAVTVRLYAPDGTALATVDTAATLPTAGTTATVTVPAYPVTAVGGVALSIGTWGVRAVWSAPAVPPATGPITPGPDTTVSTQSWPVLAVSGTQFCSTSVVTTTSVTPVVWRLDLHVTQRPFNGATAAGSYQLNTEVGARFLTTEAVGGVLSIGGSTTGDGVDHRRISAGQSLTVKVCNYSAPAPAYDPTLLYTVTSSAPSGSRYYACMTATVAVTGSPQFYVGWRADVDVAPLRSFIAAAGGSPGDPQVSGNITATHLSRTTWRVVPTAWNTTAVRDGVSQSFPVCMYG